jgi:cytosine/adenosine deaminase-related metal-dependent hydrolase
MASLKLTGATLLPMTDALDVVAGDLSIVDGRIAAVGVVDPAARHDRVIDVAGALVLPGFIQTHVHLCQTLFRGLGDDLPLLAWLRRRVWPLEAAHDPRSLAASAQLAAAELLLGGTTTVLTMETVHDTDAVFEALVPTGLRAVVGKCLMDAADGAPARLHEPAARGLADAAALGRRWHGAADGRLHAALAPRFAVSCSEELLHGVAGAAAETGLLVHTHAAEQRDEVAAVRARTGMGNVEYLGHVGLTGPRLCLAHCVWVDGADVDRLASADVKVLHCPGSNLKLGSGLAPVAELRRRGISVSLGADGGACNNRLDMFAEMRLAATLQAVRLGPGTLTARDAVWMATREGARAIGRADQLGQLAPGFLADVVVLGPDAPHLQPPHDPYSAVVYAAQPSDVVLTVVGGRIVAERGALATLDRGAVRAAAATARRALVDRSGI